VTVVENGILKTFLLSRSPIRGFDHSNGHGRRQAGNEVVSRQSNLIVESKNKVSDRTLREMLLTEIQRQKKPYGLYFEQVTGGYKSFSAGPALLEVEPVTERGCVNLDTLRGGVGLYFNDLAQNGWAEAFIAVNNSNLQNASGLPSLIDSNYHTPYALHATAGIEHAFNTNWVLSADWTLETGMHGYRRYDYPSGISVFRTDNRSSYKALAVHLQGNVSRRLNLVANYTLSSAKTWGCLIGELFDYVNGVCDPFNAFALGDYGPSGEDVRHRFVLAGTVHAPAGFDVSFLSQAETARPITLTSGADRVVINAVKSSLSEFRGTPYIQTDLRVSRPIKFHERWSLTPFIEFFNLFNRNNPGNNYVGDISALPIPVNDLANVTALCPDPTCSVPVTSGKQLLVPAGALGDFFGPGTTVGIPFAAQLGVKLTF